MVATEHLAVGALPGFSTLNTVKAHVFDEANPSCLLWQLAL